MPGNHFSRLDMLFVIKRINWNGSSLKPLLVFITCFHRASDLVEGKENTLHRSLYACGLFKCRAKAILRSASVYLLPLLFLLASLIWELRNCSFWPWKCFDSCWTMLSGVRLTFSRSFLAFCIFCLILYNCTLRRFKLFSFVPLRRLAFSLSSDAVRMI